MVKVVVKRLHQSTPAKDVLAEYECLRRLNSIHHPNIVETIAAFRLETMGSRYFNFVFPLAIGDLKRLFEGGHDRNRQVLRRARAALWHQFVGLASALAYLHEEFKTAHRDIRPANVLIYSPESATDGGGDLVLKITDFGLAVDLTKASSAVWDRSRSSARSYDSPETRRPLSTDMVTISQQLFADDVWKMGCVFTEMLAFLVDHGSSGVSRFRRSIRTIENNVSSDLFNDTRFDDGEKVKPQVTDWLDQVARKDERSCELVPLIKKMLSVGSERLTARAVCSAFLEVSRNSLTSIFSRMFALTTALWTVTTV